MRMTIFKRLVLVAVISFSSVHTTKASGSVGLAQCMNMVAEFVAEGLEDCAEKHGGTGFFGIAGIFRGFFLSKCVEQVYKAGEELGDYCNELFGGVGGSSIPSTLDNNFNLSKRPKVKLKLEQMEKSLDKKLDGTLEKIDAI